MNTPLDPYATRPAKKTQRRLRTHVLCATLFLTSGTAGASGADTPAPLPTQTLTFSDAKGPPKLGCKEALTGIPPVPPPEKPVKKKRSSGYTKPDPTGMKVVTLDGTSEDVLSLPGRDLSALPLQPLEATPQTLAKIADVMHRGNAGERIRLSFFGASHTGGDFWTGHMRRVLQDRWGDLGHGFILPAALYKGYRGNDVNLCRTDGWISDWAGKSTGHDDGLLGFAGMSVSSGHDTDFGWVETTRTNPHGRSVEWFDVYYLAQPDGGTLEITVDESETQTISTAHSSNELRRVRVKVPDGRHRLVLSPAGDGQVRLFGVSLERDGGGALVDAMGVRGRQAKTWLKWDASLTDPGWRAIDPDLVVLAYGTNEAADQNYDMEAYEADLRRVLERLRAVIPTDVPCVLAGPSDRGYRIKKNVDTYAIWDRTAPVANVQRKVAPDYGCAFWDWQQASGGPGSMIAWRFLDPPLAAGDFIHYTASGYRWMGNAFINALDDTAAKNRPAE